MDQNEYNQCVALHADHLYRFIVKNIKQQDVGSDIVQNAFISLWNHREGVPFSKAKSWLFTTAYRKMIDEIRKTSKTTLVERIPEHVAVATEHTQHDLRKILHDALETLPDIQKQLVLLKDYEGYSYDELASITGLNTGQVKINLFRARTTLKKLLVSIETSI